MFQKYIDFIGSSCILQEFTEFLGRNNNNIIIDEQVPYKFTGLCFNKGHWKYHENNETHDSYKKELQLVGTNNYCQSYAAFLYVSNGQLKYKDIEFFPKKYIHNVQQMSKIWHEFFTKVSTYGSKYIKWFNYQIKDSNKNLTMSQLLTITKKLSEDTKVANEFSNAKEELDERILKKYNNIKHKRKNNKYIPY